MVNNSGGHHWPSYNATEEQWATAVQRSLLFFARMSREAIPHLKQQGGGRIINILASTVYQPIPKPGTLRCYPYGRGGVRQKFSG